MKTCTICHNACDCREKSFERAMAVRSLEMETRDCEIKKLNEIIDQKSKCLETAGKANDALRDQIQSLQDRARINGLHVESYLSSVGDKIQKYEIGLAFLYGKHAQLTSHLCDGYLDKSGALLGRVRNWNRKLKDCPEFENGFKL